jgi:hypothetical protein
MALVAASCMPGSIEELCGVRARQRSRPGTATVADVEPLTVLVLAAGHRRAPDPSTIRT